MGHEIMNEDAIRQEMRRLDERTHLAGAEVPIRFYKKGKALGKFSWSSSGKIGFSFNQEHFSNPDMVPEVLLDTVRHEYAHYMDYMNRGMSSHDKEWKKCCKIVGAIPDRYYNETQARYTIERVRRREQLNQQLSRYTAGMVLNHPRFGLGKIARILGDGLNRFAEVEFDQGMKNIGLRWAESHCPAALEKNCA